MQKISFFIDSLAGGGAERVMLNLANHYAGQGYSVDIVLAHKRGEYLNDVDERVRLIDLNVSRFWQYFVPLIRYFRQERPVVMLSATTILNLLAILTKKLAMVDTRLVVSEHIDIQSFAERGALQKPKIVKRLIRFIYPQADQIVAVSKGAANSLASFANLPVEIIKPIYNGVIDQHKLDLAMQPIDHPWFGEAEQRDFPVILGVGRLQDQKNFAMLLRAFAKLRKKMPARLIILGEGELRHTLQQQAEKLKIDSDVSLHGFADNPFKYLKNANVFALSSFYEGLPTVLIEALACGCPVVSTDCPSGPNEILENGRYGALVPVDNDEAFANALLTALTQELGSSEAHQSYKKGLQDYAKKFGVDQAFAAYSEVLLLDSLKDRNAK